MKKTMSLLLLFVLISICNFAQSGIIGESLITLADGVEKPIKEIKKDDLLLTLDSKINTIAVSRVIRVHQENSEVLQEILLADGSKLEMTSDQTILGDRGWRSFDSKLTKKKEKYKKERVADYKVDSFIYSVNSNVKIEILPIIEIKEKAGEKTIYLLELDNKDASYIANGFFAGQ